ncbi:tryptophan 2,3-dioxygenase family protein [Phaeodactylibacter luteus]|uniref:Tryptophan 2,3-dioxygenase n=1 Tax=Phaeodactylibacter luteus TaxID=1564516 RepID=A0A5C6RY53_9BACT|nr:tryptophan 2,3-dioxygenase family protein [Phaeodactylibacter luteus]TXB66292.1 tryptophan 2,3-dioxygenase [Phaeodactylibacter luteus]
MELSPEILERLKKLEEKYAVMGQDMVSYLDGLLYADYLTYWEYIHLDTLLSLQNPETPFPDEQIFIIYHQITELYFKLCLLAMDQINGEEPCSPERYKRQFERLNSYFDNLVHSFDIMVDGMDREEFLKFRMSLLPASGFQSAQYRMIEIRSTDLYNLVHAGKRGAVAPDSTVEEKYQYLYWKSGATELATGKKTLTLRQFEEKYATPFKRLAREMRTANLWQQYLRLPQDAQRDEELIHLMKRFDFSVGVRWPLSHLRSAVRYLDAKPAVIKATGGTNWQDYLPPRKQQVILFPELWTVEELDNWGRSMKFGR